MSPVVGERWAQVKARRSLLTLAAPLGAAVLLSGCSSKNLGSMPLHRFLPTPVGTRRVNPPPRSGMRVSIISHTGFDRYAGNCPDAASEDAALIDYAQSQNYAFDMQLEVKPSTDCAADPHSAAYTSFTHQVTVATLTLNALDLAWIDGGVSTRALFLRSVFTQLQQHYLSLSEATITVTYDGQTRATLTFSGQGAPTIQDSVAQS